MPTFRSPRNPNFWLKPTRLGRKLQFKDGAYETDDPDEIAILRRNQNVTEDKGTSERTGEFHRGGIVPNGGSGVATIVGPESILSPAQAIKDVAVDVRDEVADDALPALDTLIGLADRLEESGLSNRELREHAETLGIDIPDRAGKRVLLDAIRAAEHDAADDFDPNDPDGS